MKVISQAITAVNCATLAQALALGAPDGRRPRRAAATMDGGSSDSTMRELKGQPMLEHDFTPLFKLAHMLKDVQLCLEEARGAGRRRSRSPGSPGELYGAGVGRGLGEQDFAAVLEVVEGLTGDASVRLWRVALTAEIVAIAKYANLQGYFEISRTCA